MTLVTASLFVRVLWSIVVAVAEYTDVFVFLLHYLKLDKHNDIYFQTKKDLLSLSDVNSTLTPFVKNITIIYSRHQRIRLQTCMNTHKCL